MNNMSEEGKKISFGFSKFVKKTQIVPSKLNQIKTEKSSVELIDCLEGKTIKLKNAVKCEEKLLVIPLKKPNETNLDDLKKDVLISPSSPLSALCNSNSKITEPKDVGLVENALSEELGNENKLERTASEPLECQTLTLDEVAAKEILEDLMSKKTQVESRIFTVPLTNNPPSGENESTLEDYDNIPIGDFGAAMLRGMGWAPGKGIGKNEKLVTPSQPTLRPKGMGLGADNILKTSVQNKTNNEDLKMAKGSYIRVLAGQFKDSYGQVEGFDDETGRLIVKLSLKDMSVSLNEFMAQLVDKAEFIHNSKVINFTKYEQYKGDENKKKSLNTDKSLLEKTSNQKKSTDLEKGNDKKAKLSTGNSYKFNEPILSSSENKSIDRKSNRKKFSSHSSNKRCSRSTSRSISPVQKLKKHSSSSNKIVEQEKQQSLIKSRSRNKSKSSYRKSRSSSSSTSSEDTDIKYRKSSKSKNLMNKKSSHSRKSEHRKKYRASSSSSSSSSSESSSGKKSRYRTEKLKSRSQHFQKRSRSRSPVKHTSTKKHKGKKRTS